MSELILESEVLNKVMDGGMISKGEAVRVFDDSKNGPEDLFRTARALRGRAHKKTVTFSKKAFFNLVNMCRDTCTYCTYKSEPGESSASMMDRQDVLDLARLARKYRCVEALFVTGERPEEKYNVVRLWLKRNGFSSTAEYLIHCSELALSEGLFPHTNAGNLAKSEMRELKKTNVSLGLMLENSSDRLTEKGMPHHLAPSKIPAARLRTLESAGELGIPLTTGLLIGIGETPAEIIDSLFAIRGLCERFGNIQEVILQNFQPKRDTAMRSHPSAEEAYFKTVIALSRIIMPQMNIQIPPNLSPYSYQDFLAVGINDWGGISPLTPDYVNPEFSWPSIDRVAENSENAGFDLKCRFPVYPQFFGMLDAGLWDLMRPMSDKDGFVKEACWK